MKQITKNRNPLFENEMTRSVGLMATCNSCDRIIFEDENWLEKYKEMGYCKECFEEVNAPEAIEDDAFQGFTGGKWEINGTSKSLQRFHIAANGENICAVFTSIPECEANARLIAEAPAMYNALKEELSQLEEWNGNGNYTERIEKLKAIINRIENK